jgi:CrcB protein
MIKGFMLVAAGGAFGSGLRYITSLYMNRWLNQVLPWGTFAANGIGCLLIGLLMGFFGKHCTDQNGYKLLLMTGFCGGYTTFSAFALENYNLMQQGQTTTALLYILISVLSGVLMVYLGHAISK